MPQTKKPSKSYDLPGFDSFCFFIRGESRIRTCEVFTADLQSALVGRLSISPVRLRGCKYKNTFQLSK